MDTKTKTRTDEKGKPNPTGEVQVRELSDVLGSAEEEAAAEIKEYSEKLTQAKLKEFRLIHMPGKIEDIIQDEEVFGKLTDLITSVGYKKNKARPDLDMYVKFHSDQSVDVIVMYDVSKLQSRSTNSGISYARLKDHSELRDIEIELSQFKNYTTHTPDYKFGMGLMGVIVGLGSALIGVFIGDTMSAGMIGFCAGAPIGAFLGYRLEKTTVKNSSKNEKEREEQFKKTFSKFSQGTDAINKGIYGK